MKIEKLSNKKIYRRAGILYANRDGGPVLKGESSWRNANGFFFNTKRTGMVTVQLWHHL